MADITKDEFVALLKSVAAGQADLQKSINEKSVDPKQITELRSLVEEVKTLFGTNPPSVKKPGGWGFLDDLFGE